MLLSAGAPESVRESSEQEAAGSVLGSEVTITITNSISNNTVGRPILHQHCTGILIRSEVKEGIILQADHLRP